MALLLVWRAGSEWSEAFVQGLAALGALWYWAYRSRPQLTLRILCPDAFYLELMNVGNRVAKQVRVKCAPPVPLSELGIDSDESVVFGPVEDFGDMGPDQRYVVFLGAYIRKLRTCRGSI
ncbi:MAG: hypothetical protein F4028_10230 [Acidimicrobiaceae bacterium]|nr:hypothetical protein [Acidimicrobiaceae bacterium]MXW77200.1 hypothetical protein [Acidimicrobiaceae bacterium]MYC43231.1 hypothetical protein [Acidimicrobiaceae bacterium]MYJ99355.1 hypothetical protein [Acidimicrobiaceae bacterium]